MAQLSQLTFNSLVDVGGGEGYHSYLARELFGCRVLSGDLSPEACKRAGELFGLDAKPIDIHDLDFEDGSFDVVLCSETLEHVTAPERALQELLRVARKAVLITVPKDPPAQVKENVEGGSPHAHIQAFNSGSLDHLHSDNISIHRSKVITGLLEKFSHLMDSIPQVQVQSLRDGTLENAVDQMLRLDARMTQLPGDSHGLMFLLLKNGEGPPGTPGSELEPRDLFQHRIPYHCFAHPSEDLFPPGMCQKGSRFELDQFGEGASRLGVRGWAFSEGLDPDFQRCSLVLLSESETHFFSCCKVERPDVARFFQNSRMSHSGFEANLSTASLPPGTYELGLLLYDFNASILCETERSVNVQ